MAKSSRFHACLIILTTAQQVNNFTIMNRVPLVKVPQVLRLQEPLRYQAREQVDPDGSLSFLQVVLQQVELPLEGVYLSLFRLRVADFYARQYPLPEYRPRRRRMSLARESRNHQHLYRSRTLYRGKYPRLMYLKGLLVRLRRSQGGVRVGRTCYTLQGLGTLVGPDFDSWYTGL